MEVPYVGSDLVRWTPVRVPSSLQSAASEEEEDDEPCCPPPRDLAGTVCFGPPSFRRVIWRVHQSSPSTLELIELDDNEAYMSGLQLLFTEPLSPFVALCPDQVKGEEDTMSLYTITMSGVICICKIRRFYTYRKSSTLAKSDLFQLSLAGDLARLDKVTAFAAFGGCFCIGGKSGTILCYPFEQISGDVKDLCYELKDNDARLARLWGLVARTKTSSPVRCLSLQHLQEKSVLFSLHEDWMFRLWDLSNRSRLLSFNLLKSDLSGFTPKGMWVQEHVPRTGPWKIAFLFQSTRMDIVHIYELWRLLDSGANPSTITFLSKATSTQGRVLDMKLLSDSFWKLEDANGNCVLTHSSIKGEGSPELCELFDVELEDQLFQQCGDDWEDLVLFQQSTTSNTKFPMSDMLLSRILQPGVYQHELLRKVLENHKRKLSEHDLLTLTMDDIRKEILAAVEGESIGSSIFEHVSEWKSFLGDYVMLWKQYNMPYSLLFDSYSGSVGLIRRQTVSIIRSLSPFEKLYRGVSVTMSLGGSNSDTNNCHRDVFHLLVSCTKTVARQLGRVSLSAFSEAILRKKPALLSHVSSVFLQLLSVGYDHSVLTTGTSHFGVDIARRKKMDYHQKQRKFELQISLDLQQLEETVGSWEGVLHAIEKYTDHLVDDMHVSVSRHSFEGPVYGAMNKRLVSKATAQISWTYFEAARDLLLFLGYTFKLKGQAGMGHGEVSKLQRKLTEKVQNVLLLNLLVHWLSVTFGKLTPSEDFNLHLSSLRLDSVPPDRPQNRYIDMSLSEILLSASSQNLSKGLFLRMKGLVNSEALLYNAQSFVSWIVLGENEDQQGSFSSRSVALAIALLQHGQFHALEDYLYLVESICNGTEMRRSSLSIRGEWCVNLHLMGCALIGQYRNNVKDSATVMKVKKAAHCFFCVSSAAGKDRDDLQNLLQSTGMQTSFSSLTSAASWKLQYFEWVMQIFEQNNVSEGACQFAHAALQEVNEAVKDLNVDAPEMTSAAVMIKGRLWANIFKFCLDLSHYRDAYCAIVSNPDNESKYICLRRFLIVLCEQKATGVLCGFELPYAGMLERVEQELLLKAKYCDITANPNPYKLLYSFHVERNNYRRAALYMYLYSLRLREISLSKDQLPLPFLLQEQLHALATALNALSLVHPSSAWLDAESHASGCVSQRTSTKRLRVYAETDEQASQTCRFVDLTKLEMDYTLVSAELLLVEMNAKLNLQGGDLSPADVLGLLVQSGLYEMAFTVLFRFWKGSSLKSELERIFRIMAEKWCSTGRTSEFTTRDFMSSEKSLVLSSSFLEAEDENKPAYRLSELNIRQDTADSVKSNVLQKYLELYVKLHPSLPAVVAEAMLTIDRLMELPVWLVDMMKGGRQVGSQGMSAPNADPAALVRIYLDFGRVSEAAILLLDYFKAWANQRPVDVIKRKRMCAVWFSYTLVDRLRVQLREQKKSKQLEALESLLNNGLVHHLKQIETDSSDVKSMV